jgi:hypothetical protein
VAAVHEDQAMAFEPVEGERIDLAWRQGPPGAVRLRGEGYLLERGEARVLPRLLAASRDAACGEALERIAAQACEPWYARPGQSGRHPLEILDEGNGRCVRHCGRPAAAACASGRTPSSIQP